MVLAGLVAEGLAISACWYMDDFFHILTNNDVSVRTVSSLPLPGRNLTYLCWRSLYLLFGYQPIAFHAFNLLLHLVAIVMTLATARRALRLFRLPAPLVGREDGLAFWGAMLFAVHPMCSEAVNYAAQTSILLVNLFCLIAAYFFLGWRDKPTFLSAAGALLACMMAGISKEPGSFHAAFTLGFLALPATRGDRPDPFSFSPRTKRRILLGGALLIALLAAFWSRLIASQLQNSYGLRCNILTQPRVLWEYAWRMLIPMNQCSDHYLAWTVNLRDVTAVTLLALTALLTVGLLWRACRERATLASLGCLALFHLLIRFAYSIDEPMVEYRVYLSMPWIGLLMACGVVALTSRLPVKAPSYVFGAVTAIFATLTVSRCLVWQNFESIVDEARGRNPWNMRALAQQMSARIALGDYRGVVAMATVPNQIGRGTQADWLKEGPRKYSLEKMFECMVRCETYLGVALNELGRSEHALERMNVMLESVRSHGDKIDKCFEGDLLQTRAEIYDKLQRPDDAKRDRIRAHELLTEWNRYVRG